MTGGLLTAFLLPSLRALLDLDLPRPLVALAAVGVVALAFLCLEAGDRAAALVASLALRLKGVGKQTERVRPRK
jgi:hypothetical protein